MTYDVNDTGTWPDWLQKDRNAVLVDLARKMPRFRLRGVLDAMRAIDARAGTFVCALCGALCPESHRNGAAASPVCLSATACAGRRAK